MESAAERMRGRSVFRRYDTEREILWGNAHFHLVGGLSATGELAICDWGFDHCVGARVDDGRLFSPLIPLSVLDPRCAGWLRDGVAASMSVTSHRSAERGVRLIEPGALPLNPEAPLQFVIAGQFLFIPAETHADVEIEMSLVGPAGGSLRFSHDLILGRRQEYVRTATLEVGQTMIIRYSFLSEKAFDEVELRVWAEDMSTSGMEIVTRSARIRLSPATAEDSPYGLTEREVRVVATAD
jgi:hypothetical protein